MTRVTPITMPLKLAMPATTTRTRTREIRTSGTGGTVGVLAAKKKAKKASIQATIEVEAIKTRTHSNLRCITSKRNKVRVPLPHPINRLQCSQDQLITSRKVVTKEDRGIIMVEIITMRTSSLIASL